MKKMLLLLALTLIPLSSTKATLVETAVSKTVSITVYVVEIDFFTEKLKVNTYGGTGVFISSTGYILSCSHLFFQEPIMVQITTADGMIYMARDIKINYHYDLSLLKVKPLGPVPYMTLADSDKVKQGSTVYSIGSALGLDSTVCKGIVSFAHRAIGKFKDLIQTDAMINPGNSGGPLVNTKGELVGINIFTVQQDSGNSGLGFAVSSNVCKKFIKEVLK